MNSVYQEDLQGDEARMAQARHSPSLTGFGQEEALAFWHGMQDHPDTLSVSFLAGWLEDIFGIHPKPPFADPRLEAIRRLTVALRRGSDRQRAVEMRKAREAGVNEQQIAALRFRLSRSELRSRDAA